MPATSAHMVPKGSRKRSNAAVPFRAKKESKARVSKTEGRGREEEAVGRTADGDVGAHRECHAAVFDEPCRLRKAITHKSSWLRDREGAAACAEWRKYGLASDMALARTPQYGVYLPAHRKVQPARRRQKGGGYHNSAGAKEAGGWRQMPRHTKHTSSCTPPLLAPPPVNDSPSADMMNYYTVALLRVCSGRGGRAPWWDGTEGIRFLTRQPAPISDSVIYLPYLLHL